MWSFEIATKNCIKAVGPVSMEINQKFNNKNIIKSNLQSISMVIHCMEKEGKCF